MSKVLLWRLVSESETLCLQLCTPVTVPTLSTGTPRLITSSKSFHPPRYLPPCTSDSAFADTACFYKFNLLLSYEKQRLSKKATHSCTSVGRVTNYCQTQQW